MFSSGLGTPSRAGDSVGAEKTIKGRLRTGPQLTTHACSALTLDDFLVFKFVIHCDSEPLRLRPAAGQR